MSKTCSCKDHTCCRYSYTGNLYIFCKYEGYCDFKLPKDGVENYEDLEEKNDINNGKK